jgi:hypothetical protein
MKNISLLWCAFILSILLLVACQSNEQNAANNFGIIEQVENIGAYLAANVGVSASGGEVFCAYEPLDAEQGEDGRIFIWAMCYEYYLEEDTLMPGTGISVPVVLQIEQTDDRYQIVGHLLPRDGTFFGPDVQASFPKSAWPQIMPESLAEIDTYNSRANRLEQETQEMARSYFAN